MRDAVPGQYFQEVDALWRHGSPTVIISHDGQPAGVTYVQSGKVHVIGVGGAMAGLFNEIKSL